MNKTTAWFASLAVLVAFAGTTLFADRVKLRSGQAVEGNFLSADAKVVRVLLANGRVAEFPVDDVASVEFAVRKKEPPPAAAAPNPANAPKPVMIPQGTVLSVRLTEGVDVDATKNGAVFKSVLDDPVMMNGGVVIPRNAVVM